MKAHHRALLAALEMLAANPNERTEVRVAALDRIAGMKQAKR